MPSATSLPPSWTGARPTSRSQRQRDRSYEAGFVDHREWLSDDDHRRAGRIHRANLLGWPAEIDEVLAEYGERLGDLSPEIVRTLYRQAKREIGGRDYLNERWLPYKRLAGTARATGQAGAGRAAPLFIRLIEELRRRGYRNWAKRGGGQRWLLDEWFEDQATLGKAIGRSRIVVNRLLRDPDMKHFVVKIPRRWFECRVSGGATRNASLRYLFAIEDPLTPDDVEPIQARMRELLNARLRDGQEEPEFDRDKAGGHDDETPLSPEFSAPEAADDPGCAAQNAVSKRYPERSITLTPQSEDSELNNSETVVRRSAREDEARSSYSRRDKTPAQSFLAPRKAQTEEQYDHDKQGKQRGAGQVSTNTGHAIEPNRRSNHEIAPAATAELGEGADADAQHMPLRRPAGSSRRRAMTRHATAERATAADTSHHGETGDATPPTATTKRAVPACVELGEDAFRSEFGLRLALTNDRVGKLAYHLALDAEERDLATSGRTASERESSAKAYATEIVSLLAKSTCPYDAMADFAYLVKGRAYRSARREKSTGVRVPWTKPSGYFTSLAHKLVAEMERASWACAEKNAEEQLAAQVAAEAERWERERQAIHEEERTRRVRRAAGYVATQEAELTGNGEIKGEIKGERDGQHPTTFAGWQRQHEQRQHQRERQQSSHSTVTGWAEGLSEEEALKWL